ncbi:hypothetical protein B0T10DRAFT_530139 [Thelonectria olida]|uniref:Short-chain dehydrogenase/reductase 3 n=1 Tax=Thelonectria olida TaxID=1576542 RepID=A0A9P8W320_9HYPO|nr:hypothetical protein B0T10DRAFT_530139 [Thelonectria olida]
MGAHMVRKFSHKSVRVLSLDINPPQNALPANAHFFQVDVTSPDAVHETAEKIRHEFGDPTVLINNAGIVSGKTILDIPHGQLKRMFDVNILAHFWLVKEFLPAMVKENHGHVVTMASVASFLTISNNVDYSCVKSGLVAFNEGLAQELRHRYNARGVLTSIVYPFWVRTPLIKNLIEHPTFKDGVLEPEDVAGAVVDRVVTGGRGDLFVPGYGAVLAGMRGFPAWFQELVRDMKAGVLRETGF